MHHPHETREYEVAILGGGSAGLSAALTLARARRSVIVVDHGQPRNAPAAAAHGLLGNEGVDPLRLLEKGRAEASAYGATIAHAEVRSAERLEEGGFAVELGDGARVVAQQLIIATGTRDELPEIEGLAARWGRDVVHCPYCHGWEIRDQRIVLIATGPMSAKQAMLFHQWSAHVTLVTSGLSFGGDDLEMLAALGIDVVTDTVSRVEVADDRITGALLASGGRLGADALAVPTFARARLEGLEPLGLDVTENPMGVAVTTDEAGRTSVAGVWAAGNVANPTTQVSESAAQAGRVAMTLNTEMVFARANAAVAAGAAS
ncbi:NAD(P)/FAD-dependent oxidoreductase [Leucobacter sp. UCMA 4100]|uniref:NAD(P)/FAD-dependent oxidoreductase n=1 Tax=Leucobacter sp. UCMA 4100 TaxID=2810534 RepID=UPI0022EAC161|nr:NAD(P)/FAD-dependent oxidoreductase [Leucobacter sp. UCMA 4100]MDA3146929.1 NAD(P)/FAD-dependent oxidoreductase [Leucobacter sp. UCMA 4100]